MACSEKEIFELHKTLSKQKAKRGGQARPFHFVLHFIFAVKNNMVRVFVQLKQLYIFFSNNKTWILSILFVCSIIKASIWYALFGINILSYSNIQDLFINFAEYFMSLITTISAFILCSFMYHIKSKGFKIISSILFISLFCLYNIIFRMIMPLLFIIFISCYLYTLYKEQKKAHILASSLVLLLCFTLEQPLEQYFYTRLNKTNNIAPSIFIEKPANYDIFSFEYLDQTINSYSRKYYYIGGNSNYFFFLNKDEDSTMIIPKSECSNIKGTPMSLKKILERYS